MNVLKLFVAGIAVCLVVAGARAEDADLAKMLVGKWEITKAAEGTPPAGTIVEFTKDGVVKVNGKKDDKEFTMEGTYKVEPHKFVCTFKDGDKEKKMVHTVIKITDTDISFKNDDGTVVECKKKS
jgi:uncharacterized protein (TIGR03066 family)